MGSTGTMVAGIVHPFGNVRSGLGISSRSITGKVEHTDAVGLLLNVYVGEVFMHGLQHLERVVQGGTVSLENVFTRIPTEALVGWSTRRLPASAQTFNRLVPLPWRTAKIRSSWWLVGCGAFPVTVLRSLLTCAQHGITQCLACHLLNFLDSRRLLFSSGSRHCAQKASAFAVRSLQVLACLP